MNNRPLSLQARLLIQDILAFALITKPKTADIFVDFAPHVGWITVRIYKGGYSKRTPDDELRIQIGSNYHTSEEAEVIHIQQCFNLIKDTVEGKGQ
jgi:hypothetical protein